MDEGQYLLELLDLLNKHLDEADTRELCIRLGTSYDNLGGNGLRAKQRELIHLARRRGRLHDFIAVLRRDPRTRHVAWPDPPQEPGSPPTATSFPGQPLEIGPDSTGDASTSPEKGKPRSTLGHVGSSVGGAFGAINARLPREFSSWIIAFGIVILGLLGAVVILGLLFLIVDGKRPPPESPGASLTERLEVPGGTFPMGSNEGDLDEAPVHEVTISEFFIDVYPVTNAQFAAFLNTSGNQTEGGKPWLDVDDEDRQIYFEGQFFPRNGFENHPAVEITWYAAKSYCEWTGGRLPTEAEWEYVARGEDGYIYPWGNDPPDCKKANFGVCNDVALPVNSNPEGKSWIGAAGMAGNVREWVNDWYSDDYYQSSPKQDPSGPQGVFPGTKKVVRGGSWKNTFEIGVRSADRDNERPASSSNDVGFRCVQEASE